MKAFCNVLTLYFIVTYCFYIIIFIGSTIRILCFIDLDGKEKAKQILFAFLVALKGPVHFFVSFVKIIEALILKRKRNNN